MTLADAYAYASEVMVRNMLARDAAEGIDAFLDKRAAGLDRHLTISRHGWSERGRHAYLVSIMKDPYEVLGVRRPQARRRSAPPIASWPSATTPTSTPASPRRRSASRRSTRPTTSCRMRTSAPATTVARSTPPATRSRQSTRSTATSATPPATRSTTGTIDPEDLESIFAHAFAGASAGGRPHGATGGRRFSARGPDAHYTLTVELPRCGQRHHAPHHPAGGPHAGRAHPRRRARRPYAAAEGPGHAGPRRRSAGRRAGRDRRRATPAVPPRGRRHHRRAAGDDPGGGARRDAGGADDQGQGAADHPAQLRHRHAAAAARARHPPGPPVRAVARRAAAGATNPELAEFLKTWQPAHPFNPRAGLEDA